MENDKTNYKCEKAYEPTIWVSLVIWLVDCVCVYVCICVSVFVLAYVNGETAMNDMRPQHINNICRKLFDVSIRLCISYSRTHSAQCSLFLHWTYTHGWRHQVAFTIYLRKNIIYELYMYQHWMRGKNIYSIPLLLSTKRIFGERRTAIGFVSLMCVPQDLKCFAKYIKEWNVLMLSGRISRFSRVYRSTFLLFFCFLFVYFPRWKWIIVTLRILIFYDLFISIVFQHQNGTLK